MIVRCSLTVHYHSISDNLSLLYFNFLFNFFDNDDDDDDDDVHL